MEAISKIRVASSDSSKRFVGKCELQRRSVLAAGKADAPVCLDAATTAHYKRSGAMGDRADSGGMD